MSTLSAPWGPLTHHHRAWAGRRGCWEGPHHLCAADTEEGRTSKREEAEQIVFNLK